MSRALLIGAAGLATYALLNIALSALVAIAWRTHAVAPAHLPPAVRVRRLFWLRLTPTAVAALVTLTIVLPAFAIHEPASHNETMGPALALLAAAALAQIGASLFIAARSALLTARIESTWLQASCRLDEGIAGGVPAFVVELSSPIVALVGIFSPKLITAQSVVDACSAAELAAIVGHERGHLLAGDNFKRWLMTALPDALRWMPIHHEIMMGWHHAAEDAADDATTGDDFAARAELAALLVKIGRLAPRPLWDAAVVSPFIGSDGLERRVRRLLRPEVEPRAPVAIVPAITVALGLIAAGIAVASPDARETIFQVIERLVELGR